MLNKMGVVVDILQSFFDACPSYSILMILSILCQCLVPFKAGGGVLVSAPPVCSSSCSPLSTKGLLSAGQVGGDATFYITYYITHFMLKDYKHQLNLQIICLHY